MATQIIGDSLLDRNLFARRRLIWLEMYRRVGRAIGRTPTRAFVVALVAWRLGDTPADLPPFPGDFGLPDSAFSAWDGTIDTWLEEVTRDL